MRHRNPHIELQSPSRSSKPVSQPTLANGLGTAARFLHSTTKPIPLPRELCFAHRPIAPSPHRPIDTLDAGSPVYILAELPEGLLRVMSLAGVMVVERDCVEMDASEGRVRA